MNKYAIISDSSCNLNSKEWKELGIYDVLPMHLYADGKEFDADGDWNFMDAHEYYESIQIELDATKNQLTVIKQIFKELEKKFETVKQICENLFSKISLKKKEKEEFKILLKVMDFTDEKISLIIDKKKK